jgi:pimeloyl-ACP methyl ester carboxylesterase
MTLRRRRTSKAINGLRLTEWPANGPSVVLLHGLGDCGAVWTSFVENAADLGHFIAPDLPGHGDSARFADGKYDLARIVETTSAALRTLSLRSALLVGHSLGAAVALQLAAQAELPIAGLVCVELTSDVVPQAELLDASMRDLFRPFRTLDEFVSELGTRLPHARPDDLRSYAASTLRPSPEGYLILSADPAVLALLRQPLAEKRVLLHRIAASGLPSAFLRGQYSGMATARETAEYAREAGAHIPAITIPKSGHHVILDRPDAVAKAIGEFDRDIHRRQQARVG